MTRFVVLDANVLIQFTESQHKRHDETVKLIAAVAAPLLVNNVTLAEVLVGAVKVGAEERVLQRIVSGLRVQLFDGIGAEWSLLVAELRANAKPKISIPDAIVLATAIEVNGQVLTFDGGLAKAAREHRRLYVPTALMDQSRI